MHLTQLGSSGKPDTVTGLAATVIDTVFSPPCEDHISVRYNHMYTVSPRPLQQGTWTTPMAQRRQRTADGPTVDAVVSHLLIHCGTERRWSLHVTSGHRVHRVPVAQQVSIDQALVGHRTPVDAECIAIHVPAGPLAAIVHGGPYDPTTPTGVVLVIGFDGTQRYCAFNEQGIIAYTDRCNSTIAVALARAIGADISLSIDGRDSALKLLAATCLGVAVDGGTLREVVSVDPVALTAAVLGHLGGSGRLEDTTQLDYGKLTMAMEQISIAARAGHDWLDADMLTYIDDMSLRRSVAGLAQSFLAYDDDEAQWWGVEGLCIKLDAVLGDTDTLLAAAAGFNPELSANIRAVIAGRRHIWQMDPPQPNAGAAAPVIGR